MEPKAYGHNPTYKFPGPNTPPILNRDDIYPFVNPYHPMVV